MSPSKSYNLKTLEKTASTILPGNPGAFTNVKFGFGARLASNNYSKKVGTDFTNFYYFDNKGIVNAEGKSLRIITDPLQGVKTVNYVTSTRFVYDIDDVEPFGMVLDPFLILLLVSSLLVRLTVMQSRTLD